MSSVMSLVSRVGSGIVVSDRSVKKLNWDVSSWLIELFVISSLSSFPDVLILERLVRGQFRTVSVDSVGMVATTLLSWGLSRSSPLKLFYAKLLR